MNNLAGQKELRPKTELRCCASHSFCWIAGLGVIDKSNQLVRMLVCEGSLLLNMTLCVVVAELVCRDIFGANVCRLLL